MNHHEPSNDSGADWEQLGSRVVLLHIIARDEIFVRKLLGSSLARQCGYRTEVQSPTFFLENRQWDEG
jgi:hypothetical protein